jgi:undecaprenyl diphosphate synthase
MDGNRRWAAAHGLPSIAGHVQGVAASIPSVRAAPDRGIEVQSLYVFSQENWRRTEDEVSGLFGLVDGAVRENTDELIAQGVRVRIIGRAHEVPDEIRSSIQRAEDRTRSGTRMVLNIAFNYSGRSEIIDAIRALLAARVNPPDVSEELVERNLYTWGQPDVDLLIRTGGEHRMSNFLLWQSNYAELVFTSKLWPDYSVADLDSAIVEFANRHRRFGS